MIDRLEILVSRLRRSVSRNRWTARLAGHAPEEGILLDPGLILIQIDGLGEQALRRALAEGRMPFLARLVADGYQIHPLYCGLPSDGAAFQAEFFYGAEMAVPSARYRDPALARFVSLQDPLTAAAVEERLTRGHDGLLREGSAWVNVFTGGAKEAHLCAAAPGLGALLGGLPPWRVAGLLFWHGWSVLRVLAYTGVLIGLAFRDAVRRRRRLGAELRRLPVRVVLGSVLRETAAAGAAIDAERGLPVIQLSLVGHDVHAHERGPRSRLAMWSLSGIDRSLRRVWHAAHRSRRRDYQLWVYSDHGVENVESYSSRFGVSVEEAAIRIYRDLVPGTPSTPGEALSEDTPPPSAFSRMHWLSTSLPRFLRPPAGARRDAAPAAPALPRVLCAGGVAHVYLPPGHDRALRERYAEALVMDAHIPLVLLGDGPERALAVTGHGRSTLPENAAGILGPDHPHLGDAARDLAHLASHPAAGDLLLLGSDLATPLSFQDERGANGGPGPAETSAFAVIPPEAEALATIPRVLRPATLRRLALHTLRRGPEPRVELVKAVYAPPTLAEQDGTVTALLRLMTYNVHGCRGMDGVYSPGRIARVIARERPDVVCLQEVDQERTRSGRVDQAHLIAERIRAEVHFHAVSELDEGRFGNAVLSTLPMRRVAARALPAVPSAWNLWTRGALWVTVEVEGREIHVLNTHLSILDRERRVQARALTGPEWLGGNHSKGPVVLAGDLNAAPGSPSVKLLQRTLRDAVPPEWEGPKLRTWSGRIPVRRIDHVLVSDTVSVNNVYVPRTRLSRAASDHLPLVVDLVFRFPRAPETLLV